MTIYHVTSGTSSTVPLGSGDFEYVSSGGVATGTVVNGGGALTVFAGGSAVSTTVSSGGYEVVSSGGSATGTTVATSGYLIVLSGGAASNTTGPVLSTGVVLVEPGAGVTSYGDHAAGVIVVGSGAAEYILSGGTATATTVSSGAAETIYAAGSAISTTVASGGDEVVASSGTAVSTTVASGGRQDVLSGGTASATMVDGGGFQFVSSGGKAGGTVLSGGTEDVSSGGTASNTTVLSGGYLDVFAGATASGVTVRSGGEVKIDGTASGITLAEGGYVSVTGTVSGTTLANGGAVQVYGTASNTSATLNGTVDVYSGASAAITTLGFFSELHVYDGGTASNVTLNGNFADLAVDSGGTVSGTIDITSGSLVTIQFGGSALPTATISGFGGASVIDLWDVAYNSAVDSVSYSGGILTVSSGATTWSLHVASSAEYGSGTFFLTSNGVSGTDIGFIGAGDHIIQSGQSSGGIAVSGGHYLLVENGGTSIAATLSGAAAFMAYQTSPLDGGTLLVDSSVVALALEENLGTASGTYVGFGGNLINGATVVSTTVASGGLLFSLAGTALDTTVQTSGIELDFLSGTVASRTVISGGLDGVAGGAVTVADQVYSGGEQVVGGQVNIGVSLTGLPGGTASGTVVHSGGLQFINLSGSAVATQIDSGGEMVVNSGGSATSASLASGGTIDLGYFAYAPGGSASLNSGNDLLTITEGGASTQLQLAGDYSGEVFHLGLAGGGGTLITLQQACFARFTRILTGRGEVAVEDLQTGEGVVTRCGALRPIRWIGHRHVDCRHHPRPHDVWPVRISAGAFADGQPHRDLMLSPDHAVFVDGVLIPVRHLINAATIVQVPVERIGYWHVELDRHDVILAEGLSCETYLDTGNRGAFDNGGPAMQLHPDFALCIWQAQGCAPLVREGAELEAARSLLLERARQCGFVATRDPALRVIANGRIVLPRVEGRVHSFLLPAASGIRLVSRSAIPAELHAARRDRRRLGVGVARIALDGETVALTGRRPGAGWHEAESDAAGAVWRWTDGNAELATSGRRRLDLEIAMTEQYWLGRPAAPERVA